MVSIPIPSGPTAANGPIAAGTRVMMDRSVHFIDRDLISGGAPWRLLRLGSGAHSVVERWRDGGVVRAGEERFARTLVRQGFLEPTFPHQSIVDVVDQVDVVIPVFDDDGALQSLLRHLTGLHVTVVDDGSHDATLMRSACHAADVDLVRIDDNRGAGAARNVGASATRRPFLWFIDADIDVDNPIDVLVRLISHMGDPSVAVVAPRIRGGSGSSIRDHYERRFSPLDMGGLGGLVRPGAATPYVPSACLLVRRTALANGFDTSLRFGEDVDLIWRLVDEEWLVRYDASVVVTHRARDSWGPWFRQRVRYGESASALARRHGERLAPVRSDLWTLVTWISVLARRPFVAIGIVALTRRAMRTRVSSIAVNPGGVANELVVSGTLRSGASIARALVRTFGVVVVALAIPKATRRQALTLFVVGTAYRWRDTPVDLRDVPLAVADDAAYGVGVWRGALRARSTRALRPRFTRSTLGLRDVLGRSAPVEATNTVGPTR